MSQFNTNAFDESRDLENLIGRPYNIQILPIHILESTHFQTWKKIFTDENEYCIRDNIFVKDLNIHSQEDFDRIIDADYEFGFNENARIEIFKNMENYWNEDPNSSPIKLPKEGYSIFANQVLTLFKEVDEFALVSCMKKGYIELFN